MCKNVDFLEESTWLTCLISLDIYSVNLKEGRRSSVSTWGSRACIPPHVQMFPSYSYSFLPSYQAYMLTSFYENLSCFRVCALVSPQHSPPFKRNVTLRSKNRIIYASPLHIKHWFWACERQIYVVLPFYLFIFSSLVLLSFSYMIDDSFSPLLGYAQPLA